MKLRNWLEAILPKKQPGTDHETVLRSFRLQYTHFKDLLLSNAELGNLMADIDEKMRGTVLFGMNEIRALATRSVFHTMRMVTALNAISGNRYAVLQEMVELINARISSILDSKPLPAADVLTYPLSSVNRDFVDLVGGKCANLGEMRNHAKVPTPGGFGITTAAYNVFLQSEGLREEILKLLREANPDAPASIVEVSEAIFRTMAGVKVPDQVMTAINAAWDEVFENPAQTRTALRSSAISEDGILSFSGQYRTILGVTRSSLEDAFREVLASLFSPRAITYRIHHGVPFEQCAMGMACIEMVDALCSGIIFSRHPVNPLSDEMVLNAVWGLGAYAVDGIIEPDTWHIKPGITPQIMQQYVADKRVQLISDASGKHEQAVPEELRKTPCLNTEQVMALAAIAAKLEAHYRHPQDVEWAMNKKGEILVLQSRPMRLASAQHNGLSNDSIPGAQLLVEHADIACAGIGSGAAIMADSMQDLSDFPTDGILVAKHSLPNYVLVMNRAQAIVTEAGSITGHMASLAREFNVPTILNAKGATKIIQDGQLITVDAITGRIYSGSVPELIALKSERRLKIADTPVHATLRQVADQITPLHLLDPKSPLFKPESCTTLHDVMRFVHERCYTEMFRISDRASDAGSVSCQLKAKLPIDLRIIDLGGGLKDVDGPYVYMEQIESVPLSALLSGMLSPEVHVRGPRPVDVSGFLSVMSQHMLEPPNTQVERFGERSYAIASDKYLNFSSRVGYHYSVIDAYCGQTISKNYITFQFKGGAADEIRRVRRVRCIAEILSRLDFVTEVRGDMTQAKFQKYSSEETRERLDQLGRLLIVTRQMDMLMTSENAVKIMADNFMAGKYH
ncbi:MAG: phosphoenolpyruvate synthase [Desulfovibrionales bacterium]|nr:phosphoenolpyruvate synthase [Desulfovibrionales bacterium]